MGRPVSTRDVVRVSVRIERPNAEWAEAHAKILTMKNGGKVRNGGAGVVTVSEVIDKALECLRRSVARKYGGKAVTT